MNHSTDTQSKQDQRGSNSFAPLRLCVRSCAAFTFVEILAALVFLAILVPAIMQGITISNRASIVVERSAIATELAQNKLNELTLNDAWTAAETQGDFGSNWPGMRWTVAQATWDLDKMTLLTVKAFFTVQGQEQNVSLSTLVYSSTSTATTSGSSQNR